MSDPRRLDSIISARKQLNKDLQVNPQHNDTYDDQPNKRRRFAGRFGQSRPYSGYRGYYSRNEEISIHSISEVLSKVRDLDDVTDIVLSAAFGMVNQSSEDGLDDGNVNILEAPTHFTRGVSAEDFTHVLTFLRHDEKTCNNTKTIELKYTHDDGKWIVRTTETGKCIGSTIRLDEVIGDKKLSVRPDLPYDCRITCKREIAFLIPETIPDNFYKKTLEEKWEFHRERNTYRIILTKSTVLKDKTDDSQGEGEQNRPKRVYDIRLELMPDVLADLQGNDDYSKDNISNKFWKNISWYGKQLDRNYSRSRFGRGSESIDRKGSRNSRSPTSPYSPNAVSPLASSSPNRFPELKLKKVSDPTSVYKFQQICIRLVTGEQQYRTSRLRFPGSLPISFSRRHWKTIQDNEYFVSEKTDGIRYMLYISRKYVMIFGRKFNFYLVSGFEHLSKLYATNGDTLLDGEMVTHRVSGKPFFLVFDAIAINGDRIADLSLKKRLECLRDRIIIPYRRAIDKGEIDRDNHPFTIIGKLMVPKKAVASIVKHIHKDKNGDHYYKDGKRNHATDGIIFTPNGPYTPFTDHTMHKWKFVRLNTVDFQLGSRRGGKYTLLCNGDHGELECGTFPEVDMDKLRQAITHAQPPYIIECNYDTRCGLWRYVSFRGDKKRPNHFKTMMEAVLCISERVTIDEIKYRVVHTSANDRWDEKMKRSKSKRKQKQDENAAQSVDRARGVKRKAVDSDTIQADISEADIPGTGDYAEY